MSNQASKQTAIAHEESETGNCVYLGPVKIFDDAANHKIIDGFHAMIDGVKTRIFPATGHSVSISELGDDVRLVGDNLGLGDPEQITLADIQGNWCEVAPDELLPHPVWARMNENSRKRVKDCLGFSRDFRAQFQSNGGKS